MEVLGARLLKLRCNNHYLFGDMEFDFTDKNGNPVDTIIIAGENGAGKSTLLNMIYAVFGDYDPISAGRYEADILIDSQRGTFCKEINIHGGSTIDFGGFQYIPNAIFSDVDINYRKDRMINTVTALDIDQNNESRKSNANLAREIEQLLIDIQNMDSNEFTSEVREARRVGRPIDKIPTDKRILRFISAYDYMFGKKLTWGGVDNNSAQKSVYFNDIYGHKIYLNMLSSGEKQIVYRGGYLLKDKNALMGALVLLDEPEISLHPEWQKKILNYYKKIFTNEKGQQTSQIFAVTHSPFIIHSNNRYNDKVIVLKKSDDGRIVVEDNPEYYSCESTKAVEDAFNVYDFSTTTPILYVEGRTDEKYIKRAAEVYGLNLPFEVKWIGHFNKNGQEENTGCTALNQAYQFLLSQDLQIKIILLYDSDTNKKDENVGNLYIRHIAEQKNSKGIDVGIENALILDDIDISHFYNKKAKKGKYGEKQEFEEFDKMGCCDYLCSLESQTLEVVFENLKLLLEEMISLFD